MQWRFVHRQRWQSEFHAFMVEFDFIKFTNEVCFEFSIRLLIERQRNVKIFGEQFLAAEANGIDSMIGMLNFQQTLLNAADSVAPALSMKALQESIQQLDATVDDDNLLQTSSSGGGQRLTMHEIYKYVINSHGNIAPEDDYDPDGDFSQLSYDLIYLPKFVRDPLQKMRNAQGQSGKVFECREFFLFFVNSVFLWLALNRTIVDYVKLVPNEFHRKFYLRIFKWTIAFSSWNKPNMEIEAIKLKLMDEEPDDELDEIFDDNTVVDSREDPFAVSVSF
jgi:hypothetical protein